MKLRRLILLSVIGFGLLAWGLPLAWAEKMYVVDEFTLTVRDRKDPSGASVGRVKSRQAVTVEAVDGDWARVRLPNDVSGWLQRRYLVPVPPRSREGDELEKKARDLSEKTASLEKENDRLAQDNKKLAQAAATAQAERERLLQESREALENAAAFKELKAKYEQSRTELGAIQSRVGELKAQADEATASRRWKWFLAGAAVFLAGWVAGQLAGRKRRTTRIY